MHLIGSRTSPFVRRIRLLLGDRDYRFDSLDIYGADRDTLRANNPALKIPALIDDECYIFDSRVIARYLGDKYGHAPLTWDQENQLTIIDGANDSGVTLLLSKRSGIDTDADLNFYKLQHERIRYTLDWLNKHAGTDAFHAWQYPAICLYCCYDWMIMRELVEPEAYPHLLEHLARHRNQPRIQETDPRLG